MLSTSRMLVLAAVLPACFALHLPAQDLRPSAQPTARAMRAGGLKLSAGTVITPALALKGGAAETSLFDMYLKTMSLVTNLFPLWTVLFTASEFCAECMCVLWACARARSSVCGVLTRHTYCSCSQKPPNFRLLHDRVLHRGACNVDAFDGNHLDSCRFRTCNCS